MEFGKNVDTPDGRLYGIIGNWADAERHRNNETIHFIFSKRE